MRRRFVYPAAGALLSAGAPVGLLAARLATRIRRSGSVSPEDVRVELAADRPAYVYVSVSTALVFTAFGYLLGRQADDLARLSETDGLTDLVNARGFHDRLRKELGRARRYRTPLALILLDLDGLKMVNDRLGHRAGDEALRGVADVVRAELRESDVGARWGGDEFAILAPNTPREAALALAERIRTRIAARGTSPALSVSLGVAMTDPATEAAVEADALVHAADAAMYEAKARGRNAVVLAGGSLWASC